MNRNYVVFPQVPLKALLFSALPHDGTEDGYQSRKCASFKVLEQEEPDGGSGRSLRYGPVPLFVLSPPALAEPALQAPEFERQQQECRQDQGYTRVINRY